MPPSVTSATDSPPCMRATNSPTRSRSLPSKNDSSGLRMSRPASRRPVRRVSSHAMRSTAASVSRAHEARDRSGCRSVCPRARGCRASTQGDTMATSHHGRRPEETDRRPTATRTTRAPRCGRSSASRRDPGSSSNGAPDGFDDALTAIAPLPHQVDFLARVAKDIDVAVLFTTALTVLERRFDAAGVTARAGRAPLDRVAEEGVEGRDRSHFDHGAGVRTRPRHGRQQDARR